MNHTVVIFAAAILSLVFIGAVDFISSEDLSLMLLYAVPILAVSWWCGTARGIVFAVICALMSFTVNIVVLQEEVSSAIISWNAFTRLGIFLLLAYAVSLQSALKKSLAQEKLRARTDQLTGLLNKWAFQERVEAEMARAKRYQHPLSLAFIDLDNFKEVNDLQGHSRGDRLLQDVAAALLHSVRTTDFVGRVGGDEFVLCFPETGPEQVRSAVAKVAEDLEMLTSRSGWQVTASIGAVTCSEIAISYDALLGLADRQMYAAKGKGKNRVEYCLWPPATSSRHDESC